MKFLGIVNVTAISAYPESDDRVILFRCSLIPMSHTYISDLVHCVFSTKNRCNLIKPEIQSDLWSFMVA